MTVIKILPHLLDPLGGVKCQIFNFAITQSVINIFFTEFSHTNRGTIDMKRFKWDLSLMAWVQSPGRT